MGFFFGIGGPWIVLMILDLMATKRGLQLSAAEQSQSWQERLEYLLRRRERA
ncbi:hypothetical protein [Methylobacterium oxalidis]|uniref:Uncharacterized protein n=1 Tax=Methylobacterium oxalidis TaxID=944322 RepID=A0A512J454_9HYPH|nr:hypothetical protein [Methylobacterium oxalidis]GEP04731.1 hypothetical protein MOX02_27690 [Methylobacterium oxalidis]GJE30431.1 hypothetical protein LDDCCGHA_0599 [Methylobacterium oxalidis]GLS63557.1 hypothetical protein GCM10007888_19380 [Methylobacterium oxalidis]